MILLILNLTLCEQGARRLNKHIFTEYDSKSRPVERPQQGIRTRQALLLFIHNI